ncbi:MAG TPA: EAL domain-containing protein [Actinomycetota bacterium]|nr:EAL domain-containing protein [Actinomycetota bacterium]
MRSKRRTGLRTRAIALVLAGAAPALLALGIRAVQEHNAAGDAARRDALGVSRAIAAEQSTLIDAARVMLAGVAELPQIAAGGPQCASLLEALRKANPAYANLGVAGPDGAVTCSAFAMPAGTRIEDRPYFRDAVATGGFSIGEYQIGRITGTASLNVGHPIVAGGELRGVVFAAIRLTALNDIARRTVLPPGSVVTILDRNGTILARAPDPEGYVGKRFEDSRLAAALARRSGSTLEAHGFDGVKRLYGHVRTGGSDGNEITVAVGIPSAAAFANANRARNAALAGLAIVTVLSVMAGMIGSRRLVRPVRRMAETARRIEAGDMQARSDLPATGELGELARSFDDMAVSLERRLSALRYLTHHDTLTELPNRRALEDAIRTGESTGPGALLLININRFRDVNHTLGPRSGDLVLREAADRMRSLMESGVMVARVGGDEFAILLEGVDRREATIAAMGVVDQFETPCMLGDIEVDMRTRVGVAPFERPADPNEVIRRAEVAERTCRDRGLICLVYSERQDPYTDQRLRLMGALRGAESRGQMHLVFQPMVDTVTSRPVRVEALLRWRHPELGEVPPDLFIPLAEDFGLIRRLTTWVLGEAVREHKRWASEGIFLPVAVNISAISLTDPELTATIEQLLRREGVPPEAIELEITETAAMAQPEEALRTLTHLSSRGIRIAIDDFGTGHSSLSYLSRLPIDTVKIDRSFIAALDGDDDAGILVRSTIELAHKLRRSVVAEGVEDETTHRILQAAGCDCIQGFLVGTPMTSDRLVEWARGVAPAMAG